MEPPKIFIVILQYNNSEDTIRCLESVKKIDYANFEVVVVDNASSPEHQNHTKKFIENQSLLFTTHYKLLTNNTGYSGGNNAGIKYLLEHGADYVLILNPDITVGHDLLDKMVAKAESDERVGIVGPAINEGKRIVYGGTIEWLKPELEHSIKYRVLGIRDYVIGSSILIKREVFEKVGIFDERYFLYFEDADLNFRAQKAGFKLAIVPETSVKHRVSSSTGSLGAAKLLYYHYRNAHLFNLKNGPIWIKLALPFWSIYIIIKQLLKIIFIPSKREVSRAILRGITDFYRGRFGPI